LTARIANGAIFAFAHIYTPDRRSRASRARIGFWRSLAQLPCQVFGPQVRVALEHLQRFVTAHRGKFQHRQIAAFGKPGERFMPQVVGMQVFDAGALDGI